MSAASVRSEGSPSSLRLEVVAGKASGSTIAVNDRIVFGRGSEGPGQLAEDPELSRRHAEISQQPSGEYAIEDLSSTNGTFVNGRRLSSPTILVRGAIIDIGSSRLVVRQAPVAPTQESSVRAASMLVNAPPVEPPPAEDAPPAPASEAGRAQAAPAPPLELRLVVDLERGEARVALEDGGEPVRLSLRNGHWQFVDERS